MRFGAILCMLAMLLPGAVSGAETIAGQASVIDGDTLEIHGTRIRLFGIDAPESGQTCVRNAEAYRCGKDAAFALADFIGRHVVTCERRDRR